MQCMHKAAICVDQKPACRVKKSEKSTEALLASQWPYIWQFCILGSKQLGVILVNYAWSPHCFFPFLCTAHQSWSSDLRFCRDYMGLGKAFTSAADRSNAVPSISLASPASPQPKEEAPSTPRSSPWRENPAFLPPGTTKTGPEPSASSQAAAQPRSTVSADLSDRLAGMSVVGSGFQRVREVAGAATDSSVSGQSDEGSGQGNGGPLMTGRANALGRLKDRQQQAPRKTGDEDSLSKATPAKFYLQVPAKR